MTLFWEVVIQNIMAWELWVGVSSCWKQTSNGLDSCSKLFVENFNWINKFKWKTYIFFVFIKKIIFDCVGYHKDVGVIGTWMIDNDLGEEFSKRSNNFKNNSVNWCRTFHSNIVAKAIGILFWFISNFSLQLWKIILSWMAAIRKTQHQFPSYCFSVN